MALKKGPQLKKKKIGRKKNYHARQALSSSFSFGWAGIRVLLTYLFALEDDLSSLLIQIRKVALSGMWDLVSMHALEDL